MKPKTTSKIIRLEQKPPPPLFPDPFFTPILGPLFLIACVVAVFHPVCTFDFLNYDDNINIYENARIVHFSRDTLLFFWQEPYEGLYIPVIYTVWGLLAKLSTIVTPDSGLPLHPAIFHGFNLLVHGANTLLLFIILRHILNSGWAAASGALLFALHPVQVEAVAWVTGLKDLLSGFFSLLAFWQYLSYVKTAERFLTRSKLHYGMASLCFGAAILTKPSAVVLPLMLTLVGHYLLARKTKQLALEIGPWILFALTVILVTTRSQTEVQNLLPLNMWERFLVAGDAISFYLSKLLLPVRLGPDYGRTPQFVLAQNWVYCTSLIPLLLTILLWWKGRRPWALASTGLLLAALLPVLGFIPFEFQATSTVADRYLYMAMLGPAFAVAWLGEANRNQLLRVMTIGCLVFFAIQSTSQLRNWRDSIAFNTNAVQINPRSAISYINLGIALKEANRTQEAITALQKSVEIATNYPHPYIYLGDMAHEAGTPAEALHYYTMALGVPKADFALIHNKIGLVHMDTGNSKEAITSFKEAVAIDPSFAEAYNNLGGVYSFIDQLTEAAESFQQAIAAQPNYAPALNNLSKIELQLGHTQNALTLAEQAKALGFEDPEYFHSLQKFKQ